MCLRADQARSATVTSRIRHPRMELELKAGLVRYGTINHI